MNEQAYRRRLHADVAQWTADGLIGAEAEKAILARYPIEAQASRIPSILMTLGMVLLAAAVAALVAANWQDIPRLLKLSGIIALIIAGHGFAWHFATRDKVWAFEGAATFGTLCFIAGLALVGQMYHIPEDWRGATLVTMAGAGVAAAYGSRGSAFVAIGAFILWTFATPAEAGPMLRALPLVLWFGAAAIAVWMAWDPLRQLAALALMPVLVVLFRLARGGGGDVMDIEGLLKLLTNPMLMLPVFGALGLCCEMAGGPTRQAQRGWLALPRPDHYESLGDSLHMFGRTLTHFAVVLALVDAVMALALSSFKETDYHPSHALIGGISGLVMLGAALRHQHRQAALVFAGSVLLVTLSWYLPLWLWLRLPMHSNGINWLIGASTLAAMIGFVYAGLVADRRSWFASGGLGFAAVVITLLSVTVGTLLGQTIFFLLSGFLVIGFAMVARWVMARKEALS